MSISFNGKPFKAGDFEKSINKAILEGLQNLLREKLATIRHPETGEFPVMVLYGDNIENLRAHLEGSPELIEIIKKRLNEDEEFSDVKDMIDFPEPVENPKAFLSYGTEDKKLVGRIAVYLQNNGIDTWWDEWCIDTGDSLRRKIEEGLEGCTHFVVLLTETSIQKEWVNEEIDAALVKKINNECRFLPLRYNLDISKLSPLLKSRYCPEISDDEKDISSLVNEIYGVNKKPPLGQAPNVVSEARTTNTGYSAAATQVAKIFVERSPQALSMDVQMTIEELEKLTGFHRDDVVDALHELSNFIKQSHDHVLPQDELYVVFDKYWRDWTPSEDALRLATDLVNDDSFPTTVSEMAELYGWEPRRINVAIAYLMNRNLIGFSKVLGSQPWILAWIDKTDDTRRFVKGRV